MDKIEYRMKLSPSTTRWIVYSLVSGDTLTSNCNATEFDSTANYSRCMLYNSENSIVLVRFLAQNPLMNSI